MVVCCVVNVNVLARYSQHAQGGRVGEGAVLDVGDAVPLQQPAHKHSTLVVSRPRSAAGRPIVAEKNRSAPMAPEPSGGGAKWVIKSIHKYPIDGCS